VRPPVDLHSHSTFSDGTLSVEAICELAVRKGIEIIALSDHDTTDGLPVMQDAVHKQNTNGHRLSFIPAIEVSSGENGIFHILGYGIKPKCEPLQSELVTLRRKRVERNKQTIRLLDRLLNTQLLPEGMEQGDAPHPVPGRMHVARLLKEKHYVKSVDEAFRKYLGIGMPGYVPLEHMSAEGAIERLLQSQAVPVLAHPMRITRDKAVLETLISHLKACGLMGLEVYHPSASRSEAKWLQRIARDQSLLVTGGSDFHGERGMHSGLGEYPSGWQTWKQDVEQLQTAVKVSASSNPKETIDV